MVTMLVVAALVGFGVYKTGALAANHPNVAAGAGKLLLGLFRK